MKFAAVLLTFLLFGRAAFAHKNHPHPIAKAEVPIVKESTSSIQAINGLYKSSVKSIFQKSCFDCHSQSPRLPWYHGVPLVRTLIDDDLKDAKEHLDFSNDFPFSGHGSPKEDLDAIADSINDGSMPPLRYRVMHWKSDLRKEERQAVLKWVSESQKLLENAY